MGREEGRNQGAGEKVKRENEGKKRMGMGEGGEEEERKMGREG